MREIRVQMEQLPTALQQLLQGSNIYGRGLNEAQDIIYFNNQAEKVLWENIAFNASKHFGVI
jgi:hypothetical protein